MKTKGLAILSAVWVLVWLAGCATMQQAGQSLTRCRSGTVIWEMSTNLGYRLKDGT